MLSEWKFVGYILLGNQVLADAKTKKEKLLVWSVFAVCSMGS